ncbi:unnamed protein product [Symbiodinium sp. CCMP2592]|nr:unnamed protein product [Symbiodinium sp. CCMP2592]
MERGTRMELPPPPPAAGSDGIANHDYDESGNENDDEAFHSKVSDEQRLKLQDLNKLLDISVEHKGQQIVVVGDTSAGKSTTINFLLGYPFNFVARGIGTRRPCVMTLTKHPDYDLVHFKVKFEKNDYKKEEFCTCLQDVVELLADVNDPRIHPEWFDCLEDEKLKVDPEDAFDQTPVFVELLHSGIEVPRRLVDVPGLSRNHDRTLQIAANYIRPENIVILVVGKDHVNNGGFPNLAAAMRVCPHTIVVQNFATTVLKDNQAQDNMKTISDKMGNGKDLVMHCVDYGLPHGSQYWKEGLDQPDWEGIHNSEGLQKVQRRMKRHARQTGQNFNSDRLVAGLTQVHTKLNEFQFRDIDGQITFLRHELESQIKAKELEMTHAEARVKQLHFPPEWDSMIASFATACTMYLDSTISATDGVPAEAEATGGSALAALCASLDEVKPAGQTSGNDAQDQGAKAELAWFDEKLDEKVIHLLTKYCGFESKLKLGCIRSWQRLIDEFTGMLAFAPMPCVHQAKKSHVQGQVGSGRAGTLNFNEETVKLVVELGGREGLVRPQLKQLQRRLQRLVQRDYASAVHTLEAHCRAELNEFLSLVNSNSEDEQASDVGEFVDAGPMARRQEPTTTSMILSCVKEALLEHAKSEISLELEGSAEKDDSGAPIWDDVIKKHQKRLKSGMMVREGENTLKPAALHWMLPFKFNNGGQMSLRKLRFENSDKDSAWGIWPFARSTPTFPNTVDRAPTAIRLAGTRSCLRR